MTDFLSWMDGLPDALLYIVLSLGAGVENFVPAVPADTFVALGGFLAGRGQLVAGWVVLGTWLCNLAGALLVYRLSHRHGAPFFERGWGRWVLRPHQMERMRGFYQRWGPAAIFLSRFVPGVRAVVPVFAGATHQPWLRVALPIGLASAIWYGGLVHLGVLAGRNLGYLERMLQEVNQTLGVVAVAVGAIILTWWMVTRRRPDA